MRSFTLALLTTCALSACATEPVVIHLERCIPPDDVLKPSAEIIVPPLADDTLGGLAQHDKVMQRDIEELSTRALRAEEYWAAMGCVKREDR